MNDLLVELSDDDIEINADMLTVKVKNAIKKVKRVINFPKYYEEEEIAAYLSDHYYDVIHDIAGSNYSKIGAEGQTEHSEDDVKRVWQSEEDLLKGVFAFVSVL